MDTNALVGEVPNPSSDRVTSGTIIMCTRTLNEMPTHLFTFVVVELSISALHANASATTWQENQPNTLTLRYGAYMN